MSRAFVKENDEQIIADDLPDRPISEHPNFVTAEGLAQIEAELARAHAEYGKAQRENDRPALARSGRELRYWSARRSNAEVVTPPDTNEVHFGVTVALEREFEHVRCIDGQTVDPVRLPQFPCLREALPRVI